MKLSSHKIHLNVSMNGSLQIVTGMIKWDIALAYMPFWKLQQKQTKQYLDLNTRTKLQPFACKIHNLYRGSRWVIQYCRIQDWNIVYSIDKHSFVTTPLQRLANRVPTRQYDIIWRLLSKSWCYCHDNHQQQEVHFAVEVSFKFA